MVKGGIVLYKSDVLCVNVVIMYISALRDGTVLKIYMKERNYNEKYKRKKSCLVGSDDNDDFAITYKCICKS